MTAIYTLIASWTEPLGKQASEKFDCEDKDELVAHLLDVTERELHSNSGRVVTFSVVDNTKFNTPRSDTQ